jgi:hypothetical protein
MSRLLEKRKQENATKMLRLTQTMSGAANLVMLVEGNDIIVC